MSKENTDDFSTEDAIKELQEEGFEIEGQETEVEEPEQPTEKPVEEEQEEVQEEPEEQETEKVPVDRVPKEPTLIPAWKARVAEDKMQKEIDALKQQIEASQNNPTKENKQAVADGVNDIRSLASEYGLELDDKQEQFFKALIGSQKQAVAPETLKNIEAFQQQQQIDYLENQYNQEFSKEVLPLIKAKYGEVSDEQLTTLQKKLHDIAFTEAYAKVPLSKIFKAESDDLGIKPSKQPIVSSKSGRTRNIDIDLSNIDESEFANLDGDQIDAFVAQKTSNSKWSR